MVRGSEGQRIGAQRKGSNPRHTGGKKAKTDGKPNMRATDINSYRDLEVYQQAFRLQQQVFEISKRWPPEETYALTGQIRRSSRSIGANLAEGWAKRRYEAHFLSKLTDADGELQETRHWIDTAVVCHYLVEESAANLKTDLETIGRMVGSMIARHRTFCLRPSAPPSI